MPGMANTPSSNDFDPSHPSNSVSVVIAVFNGEKFIEQTLETILAQTVRPTEVIVVNDGSTDNTVSVVEKFGDSVTIVNTENRFVCVARNTGAAKATGNWLAFCDHDDLWLPTKLEKQLRLANQAPDVHCVLTDYAQITDGVVANRSHFSYMPMDFWVPEQHSDGMVVRKSIAGKLSTFQPGITSTPIVKRVFFESVGGFDVEATNSAEDTCFHFRCLSVVPFGVVPEVLMHYRRHPDSMSADSIKTLRDTLVVWEHILANYPQAKLCRSELSNGLNTLRDKIAAQDKTG
jgi:glycosyltransferase involved in cell wall biosynthesis